MTLYWYELIHRPVGMGTHPAGATEVDPNHVNRNGYKFGKVAYEQELPDSVAFEYDLEPVHKEGWVAVKKVTKDWLASNQVRIPVDVVKHLVEEDRIRVKVSNGFEYVEVEELKWLAENEKNELVEIYKILRGKK